MAGLADQLAGMTYPALITFAIALISFIVVHSIEDVESGEPPVLQARIPLIGHMIGLLSHHNNYFTMLRYVITTRFFVLMLMHVLASATVDLSTLSRSSHQESISSSHLIWLKLLSVKAKRSISTPSKLGDVKQSHMISTVRISLPSNQLKGRAPI